MLIQKRGDHVNITLNLDLIAIPLIPGFKFLLSEFHIVTKLSTTISNLSFCPSVHKSKRHDV